MDLKNKLEKLFEPTLNDLELSLVQIQMSGSVRLKLQVMIERRDHSAVSMDDCVQASRELSTLLDVADPIDNAYTLEVTSPGEDRPLIKPHDYERFIGSAIRCETYNPIDNSKRFKGIITSANADGIVLKLDQDQDMKLSFDQIAKARLDPPKLSPKIKKGSNHG